MAAEVTIKHNKTQGQEIRVACSTCDANTYHNVILSIDEDGEETHEGHVYNWNTSYQIIQCRGCKTFSFRCAKSNSEDYDYDEDGDMYEAMQESLYPPRIAGRKGIDLIAKMFYLPLDIQTAYGETLLALNSNSPVLAGIGLRLLVERVCKEKEAVGKDLLLKIDDLVVKQVLTPAGAVILHKIRTLGNDAAHEAEPHTAEQLGTALDVVEHLLTDVYILPEQVKAVFKDKKPKAAKALPKPAEEL